MCVCVYIYIYIYIYIIINVCRNQCLIKGIIKLTNNELYVTVEHKTSHKGPFFKIKMYTSSES